MNDDIYNGDTSRVKTRGTRLNYRRASALPFIFTLKVFVLICFCCSFLSSLCVQRRVRLASAASGFHTILKVCGRGCYNVSLLSIKAQYPTLFPTRLCGFRISYHT